MAKTRPLFVREVIWRLEALGYDLFTSLIRAMPTEAASALGGALFRAIGPITSANRTATRNLRLAFPDMTAAERRRILSDQWDNFGRYITEFPIVDRLTPASGRVEVVGAEHLARIVASGQPAVLISGHFANLEIMAAVIMNAGVDCDITYRALNNPYVDERIQVGRRRYGVRLLSPKGLNGARDLLTAMGEGRSVAMLNDQKYDAGSPGLFFGRPVRTNPAAVRLAMKFGTVIQPMSIQRLGGARFRCVIHPPFRPAATGDRQADIDNGVTAINAFIEKRVRERPGEWWWVHRRWPAEAYADLKARGL